MPPAASATETAVFNPTATTSGFWICAMTSRSSSSFPWPVSLDPEVGERHTLVELRVLDVEVDRVAAGTGHGHLGDVDPRHAPDPRPHGRPRPGAALTHGERPSAFSTGEPSERSVRWMRKRVGLPGLSG